MKLLVKPVLSKYVVMALLNISNVQKEKSSETLFPSNSHSVAMPSGQSIECITTVIPQQCCANYMEHIRPTNPLTQAARPHPAHSEGCEYRCTISSRETLLKQNEQQYTQASAGENPTNNWLLVGGHVIRKMVIYCHQFYMILWQILSLLKTSSQVISQQI